jgi:hypothetical protein
VGWKKMISTLFLICNFILFFGFLICIYNYLKDYFICFLIT